MKQKWNIINYFDRYKKKYIIYLNNKEHLMSQIVEEYHIKKDKENGFYFFFETKTSKDFIEKMHSCVFEIDSEFLTVYYVSKSFKIEETLYFKLNNTLHLSMIKSCSFINLTELNSKNSFVYTVISRDVFEKENNI